MNDEYIKPSMERERKGFREDNCEVRKELYSEPHKDCCEREPQRDCCCEPQHDCCKEPCGGQDDWDFGSWLPILILIFLLCGGMGTIFGGGQGDCCDHNGGGSWILILIVIFFLCGNQGGCKDGFFGGLFN